LGGKRQAIVHDMPGVTRDRITGIAGLVGERHVQVIDTGGLMLKEDDPLGLSQQVFLAVEESDMLLFVVDGKSGLVSADEVVWEQLRRYNKPVILVVNKGDTREALALAIPEQPEGPAPEAPTVAIVGRPNVGKSSLLNKISGLPRALVSPVAGTTRDPVDTLVERDGKKYLLVDTAGIRRRSQTTGQPEELAVMMARRQIERAQLAVLVIDASQGVTSGDMAIAGTIWELGRAAIVAMNKWDLLDEEGREKLERSVAKLDELLADPGRVNVSALSGRGVEKLWKPIDKALEGYNLRLTTGQLNRIFEAAIKKVSPPSLSGAPWKLFYTTQVAAAPPTFMLFCNRLLPRNHHYRRYLENRMREELDLPGVPIRLVVRKRTE
jgi:GTP-binding protein